MNRTLITYFLGLSGQASSPCDVGVESACPKTRHVIPPQRCGGLRRLFFQEWYRRWLVSRFWDETGCITQLTKSMWPFSVEKRMSYSTFLFFNPAEHSHSILFYLYSLHNHVPFGTDFRWQPQSLYSLETEVRYIFTSTFVTLLTTYYSPSQLIYLVFVFTRDWVLVRLRPSRKIAATVNRPSQARRERIWIQFRSHSKLPQIRFSNSDSPCSRLQRHQV